MTRGLLGGMVTAEGCPGTPEAMEAMRQELVDAQASAAKAIARRNQLHALLQGQQGIVRRLEEDARTARRQGDEGLARESSEAQREVEASLTELRLRWEEVEQEAATIEASARTLEAHVRRLTLPREVLIERWRLSRLQASGPPLEEAHAGLARAKAREEMRRIRREQYVARLQAAAEDEQRKKRRRR